MPIFPQTASLISLLCILAVTIADVEPITSQGNYPWRWRRGSGTFYGGADASGTMGGACGYGNLYAAGYGQATAAASPNLFKGGLGCGGCYQVKCVPSIWNQVNCYVNQTVTVTVTNLCPAGSENPLCTGQVWHLDMAMPMYSQIAQVESGQIKTHWRRVKCKRSGNINFHLSGNVYYLQILITNVAGSGDISEVWIQGDLNGWMQMQQNWGSIWALSHQFGGQALSFRLKTTHTQEWLEVIHAIPNSWCLGGQYSAGQFNQYGSGAVARRRSMEIQAELTGVELPDWVEDGPMPLLDEGSLDEGFWNPDEEWSRGGTFDHPGEVQDARGGTFVIDVNLNTKEASLVTDKQLADERVALGVNGSPGGIPGVEESVGPKSRRLLL